MKSKVFFAFFSLTLLIGCGTKNPINGKKINQEYNKEENGYFIIREPDSVFFTKKGQEVLMKKYSKNYIVYENRFNNEQQGIDDFLKKLNTSFKKSDVADVLYSRPQPTDAKTFHWNVFAVKKQKDGTMILISNDNDLKAKEAVRLWNEMFKKYNKKQGKKIISVFLPQIQYSYKGCSVKGVIFVRALHKNNNELLNELLKLAKTSNKYEKCDNNYCEVYIAKLAEQKMVDKKLQKLVEKRYTKFIQRDDVFENGVLDKKFVAKHQNGTHLKKDKKGKDVWVKTSKLHDKGYKFIYKDLMNDKSVMKNTKITKDSVLKLNKSFHR